MKDPHVVSLKYRLIEGKGISFRNASPVQVSQPSFDGQLATGEFVAKMKQHFATADDARILVDAYLRAWEIDAGAQRGFDAMKFDFQNAHVIDRQPPDPDKGVVMVAESGTLRLSGSEAHILITDHYPCPPTNFVATPLVDILWRRFVGYMEKREPLFAMAYFCLTALESDAGGRQAAATKYGIDERVLRKIGELSSTRGNLNEARKATSTPIAASGSEQAWLEAAIRAIVRRVGQRSALGVPGSMLTLADLPSI